MTFAISNGKSLMMVLDMPMRFADRETAEKMCEKLNGHDNPFKFKYKVVEVKE